MRDAKKQELGDSGCRWMCKWCSKSIRLCVPRCWMWSLLPTPQTLFSSSCPSWRMTASQERSAQRESTTQWQSSSVRKLKFIRKQMNTSLLLVLDAPASVSDAHTEYFPILQLIANPTSSWWTDAEKRPKVFFLDVAHSASDWRAVIATVTNGSVCQRSAAGRRTVPSRPDEWVLVSVEVRDNCWGKYKDTNAPKM